MFTDCKAEAWLPFQTLAGGLSFSYARTGSSGRVQSHAPSSTFLAALLSCQWNFSMLPGGTNAACVGIVKTSAHIVAHQSGKLC